MQMQNTRGSSTRKQLPLLALCRISEIKTGDHLNRIQRQVVKEHVV